MSLCSLCKYHLVWKKFVSVTQLMGLLNMPSEFLQYIGHTLHLCPEVNFIYTPLLKYKSLLLELAP